MPIFRVVIDKTSKQVKRAGNTLFVIDAETEDQLEVPRFNFDPDIAECEWFWNPATETFDQGDPIDTRGPREVMRDIFNSATSQEQAARFMDALDAIPSFKAMIDQGRYDLARGRAQIGLAQAVITQADYDVIDSQMPGYTGE